MRSIAFWIRDVIIAIWIAAIILFGVVAFCDWAQAAEGVDLSKPRSGDICLIQTEKMELWRHLDYVGGKVVACYYIRNPKIVSNKITTGLSCVVIGDEELEKGNSLF